MRPYHRMFAGREDFHGQSYNCEPSLPRTIGASAMLGDVPAATGRFKAGSAPRFRYFLRDYQRQRPVVRDWRCPKQKRDGRTIRDLAARAESGPRVQKTANGGAWPKGDSICPWRVLLPA